MPSIYPEFEKPLPGINPANFAGRGLSKASDELTEIAEKIGVKPIMAFVDAKLMFDSYGEDLVDEDIPDLPEAVNWHAAAEGIETARKLLSYLEAHPEFQPSNCERNWVIDDLRDLEQILTPAREHGVGFVLMIDI
jgi:hypothetical protein